MEEKFSPCSTGTPKSVEFAHKPPKQEMDLSCLSGQTSAIRVPLRFDSVDLGIIYIVTSSYARATSSIKFGISFSALTPLNAHISSHLVLGGTSSPGSPGKFEK